MAAIRLRRPHEAEIRALLGRADAPYSYEEVGATSSELSSAPHSRYDLDEYVFRIGSGRVVFERARAALFAWRHFDVPWLELHGRDARVHSGQVVATLTRLYGLWFLNPCRVVYADSPAPDAAQASFAYGTLIGHAVTGEERFSVVYSERTEDVCYKVTAFSRPAAPVARLAYPAARRLQRRFVASSARALETAAARAEG